MKGAAGFRIGRGLIHISALPVQITAHIASPLTGALLIFGVHKAWQSPMLIAHFRGRYYRWAAQWTVSGRIGTCAALHAPFPWSAICAPTHCA